MAKADTDYTVLWCPTCRLTGRFQYIIHRDDFSGECGHRITASDVLEQRLQCKSAPSGETRSERPKTRQVGQQSTDGC